MSAFFDIGSLATVKNEIDQTFRQARELLAGCLTLPEVQRPLQQAQACLHQAAGALQIIGLEGAARMACEMEVFAGMMAKRAIEPTAPHVHLVAESITLLASYLDNLMTGAPDHPLQLFLHYEALQRARGLTDISPADLFFPDISRCVDAVCQPALLLDKDARCKLLKDCRQTFEQGQALWAEPHQPAGISHMRRAVEQIETIQTDAAARTFWRVANLLLGAIEAGQVAPGEHLQQVATRLGLQIRKLALCTPDDSGKEQLLRSMLYYLAQCRQPDAPVEAIRQIFQLEDYLPSPNPQQPPRQSDLKLQYQLRALLETAICQWAAIAAGEAGQIPAFCRSCQHLHEAVPAFEQPSLTRLVAQLLSTAQALEAQPINEPLALEGAATLLLIDLAIEHNGLLSASFPTLAGQQGDRLLGAAGGQLLGEAPVHWLALLEPAGRQANDLRLLRQVTEAIRSNLQATAAALDAACLEPGLQGALLQAIALLKQVAGAFDILDYARPGLLARRCATWLALARDETNEIALADRLATIAEGIAALDLFVIGLQHGQANHTHWLDAGLARLEEHRSDAAPDALDATAPTVASASGAAPAVLLEAKIKSPATAAGWPAPGADARLAQADADNDSAEQALVIGPACIPAGLFSLFQQEAAANLATLTASTQEMADQGAPVPYEVMRAAHTLAGSARTVQCHPVSELSRALEIRLHQLLDTGRAPTPADQELIRHSLDALRTMLAEFAACRYPASAPALVRALQQAAHDAATAADATLPAAGAPATASVPRPTSVLEEATGDALDPQLLKIFLEEAAELYPALCGDFRRWQEQPAHPQLPTAIQRSLHTLKGSARMTGANRLGALAHRMESMLLEAGKTPPTAEAFQALEAGLDQIGVYLDRLATPVPPAAAPVATAAPAVMPDTPGDPAPAAPSGTAPSRAVLRVAARVLDELVNDAGEISIARAGLQENLHHLAATCSELAGYISRLQEQTRHVGIQEESRIQSQRPEATGTEPAFDPLEFDRFTGLHAAVRGMADTISEAGLVQSRLQHQLDGAENMLRQQARMVRQLQQTLMRIRMVPFATITERFYQITRQVARQLDKNVTLTIVGEQVEIDRSVLETITAPIEHLLRNAIDHGIEAPAARRAAGKQETGLIAISARPGRNEIILQVSDDGAGLDLERLRYKAVERGLLPASASPAATELINFIFLPGFSTAGNVTEISGRGLGMNVVQNEITALGGRIDVKSDPGHGTVFTIYLPLTLATMQVVLVRTGDSLFALPAVMVEQVLMQKKDELEALYAAGEICRQDLQYPFFYLGRLVGGRPEPAAMPLHHSVLLLESGHGRVALHVDAIVGNQEAVVKNIGPQLARVPGIAGATILANGREVVILNPVVLAEELSHRQSAAAGVTHAHTPAGRPGNCQPDALPASPAEAERPLIMVVDDSQTVRKVTSSFLRRSGFDVVSATDGGNALALMQVRPPVLMLVDIEMPGMDGFDLTRAIRSNADTATLPIIMITSRTAEKHRNYALRLGVNAYLGKPYREEELLQEIQRLLTRTD